MFTKKSSISTQTRFPLINIFLRPGSRLVDFFEVNAAYFRSKIYGKFGVNSFD
ncbi:MAG: hypothetical protein ACJA04_001151 [Cellvibrionaceae bacterium]|jgi:hypothetical protein